ncbi:hypothetical protein EO95_02830 [Methanosarcina sp. 1.H.T.1A.1]|uniref:DUF6293 family protein n=1 Tax=Methanosarcina sp. 1.H.T.1A.1 TaxID=1483602 RepID=UPI000621D41F|nr:DUF6293 family protein [Methanosarcina sp. 1.H.T.1A.1]KKH92341.1 hypothetical protein EO95_02830 [Methanosarcina sp. 1.H.T.1A.1]
MAKKERIHIMSAGANVHNTFPRAIYDIAPADEVYVIGEKRIYVDSEIENIQKNRIAIRESINKLKEIALPLIETEVHNIIIEADTLDYIRDAVFDIYKNKPNADYYFNVSSGTTGLSIGLFMMALWIEATPYHVDMDKKAKLISVPKVHIEDFQSNPNRITILQILDRQKPSEDEEKIKKLSRIKLKEKLSKEYIPIRDTKRADRELKDGVFNSLTRDLLSWGLITERHIEGSKKEKEYILTSDGEFTLKFTTLKRK